MKHLNLAGWNVQVGKKAIAVQNPDGAPGEMIPGEGWQMTFMETMPATGDTISFAFGQEVRELDSIHTTAAAAAKRAEELDAVDDEEFPFPHYAAIDRVVVGSLHSDLREDQPQPGWKQSPLALQTTGGARRFFRDVQPT